MTLLVRNYFVISCFYLSDGEVTDILPKIYTGGRQMLTSDILANQRRRQSDVSTNHRRQRRDVIGTSDRLLGNDDAMTSYAFNSSDAIPV